MIKLGMSQGKKCHNWFRIIRLGLKNRPKEQKIWKFRSFRHLIRKIMHSLCSGIPYIKSRISLCLILLILSLKLVSFRCSERPEHSSQVWYSIKATYQLYSMEQAQNLSRLSVSYVVSYNKQISSNVVNYRYSISQNHNPQFGHR